MGKGRKQKRQEMLDRSRQRQEEWAAALKKRKDVELRKRKKMTNVKFSMPEVLVHCNYCLDSDINWNGGNCRICGGHLMVVDVLKAMEHIDDDIFMLLDQASRWEADNPRSYIRLEPDVVMVLSIQDMRNKSKRVDDIHALLMTIKDYLRTVRDFGARVTVNAIDTLLDKE